MDINVNRDVLLGKWKKLRGRARAQWGRLTQNRLDQIGGNYERLVGRLQESYGYTREQSKREIEALKHRLQKEVQEQKAKQPSNRIRLR